MPVVEAAKRPDDGGAEARSPCPPCSPPTAPSASQAAGCRRVSKCIADAGGGDPEDEHRGEQRPALARGPSTSRPKAYVSANGISEQREDLEEVRERRSGSRTGARSSRCRSRRRSWPSSLIASWLATGPPGIDCVAPCDRRRGASGRRSSGRRPGPTSTSANTIASGSRTRTIARVRSTQKLPIVSAAAAHEPADRARRRRRARRPPRRSSAPRARPSG